ncbi:peptide chain release factor N(5)-glutamine methyltransferase [Sphingomonas sp.]|uniref:peptide chain release factor N(5)-glutamine methyltransferase n=1 Tax=Sphingomonas sp. TaxID=28214 RepID=UPI002DC0255B|nr:peptide chain release factor N(5)-glutamine methyltransferase [Sphingomonas sp.]HEU4967329.1 peptide chain release factor N(5)-glutamine methyltransferase [Sphingomonas sp.]
MSAALTKAATLLAPVSPTPRLDAELLLAHALGISREALLLGPARPVPPAFEVLIRRRLAHEPVAYITGTRSFWTLDLHVTPDVLIPRPDSETLIETAIAHFGARAPATILDLGTGSGALLLASLDQWPDARGLGIDRSAAALAVARGNAERLGFGNRVRFVQGSWADALAARFDLILCNPPYVEAEATLAPDVADYEPSAALYAGPDGLDDYRRLVPQLRRLLAGNGVAVLEIGATQAAAVSRLAERAGLNAATAQDLAGLDRCVALTAP